MANCRYNVATVHFLHVCRRHCFLLVSLYVASTTILLDPQETSCVQYHPDCRLYLCASFGIYIWQCYSCWVGVSSVVEGDACALCDYYGMDVFQVDGDLWWAFWVWLELGADVFQSLETWSRLPQFPSRQECRKLRLDAASGITSCKPTKPTETTTKRDAKLKQSPQPRTSDDTC